MERFSPGYMRRHMTLRQLEVFEAIARLGSFTRAADALHLTQPTVSMQIKNLSDAVGLPLFEHVGKKMHLTEAGRELLEVCRGTFGALERFEMTIANLQGLTQGYMRLAVITTAKYFAPRLLAGFCERYPGLDISLEVDNREQMIERLHENREDFYIFGQPPASVDVEAVPFLRNPLVPLANVRHPLVGRKRVPLAELGDYPHIVREPGSGTRLAVERLFRANGLVLHPRMEVGSNEAIKQCVAAGLGVTVLSAHTLLGGSEGLALLDVEGFPIEREWYLVYPKGKQLSLAAQAFLEFVQTEGQQIADAAVAEEMQAVPPRSQSG